MAKSFADLGLSRPTLEALSDVGYESPSPIQELAIPTLLQGRDVIGQAQTGTGKTAVFGLPIMEYVDPSEPTVQALVLTPTRELCIQVTQALRTYGDNARDKLGSGIVVIGAKTSGGVQLMCMVTSDLAKKFSAGKIIKEIAPIVDGRGGGKPEMAQAGGKNAEKLQEALDAALELISKQ